MNSDILNSTAGKLLAENCDYETITKEIAKEKTKNCVGFHLLHEIIENDFNSVKKRMKELKIQENAKKMFAFTIGQKVIWTEGRFDYYFIKEAFRDNGMKLYNLTNPLGGESGGRVREDELHSYY